MFQSQYSGQEIESTLDKAYSAKKMKVYTATLGDSPLSFSVSGFTPAQFCIDSQDYLIQLSIGDSIVTPSNNKSSGSLIEFILGGSYYRISISDSITSWSDAKVEKSAITDLLHVEFNVQYPTQSTSSIQGVKSILNDAYNQKLGVIIESSIVTCLAGSVGYFGGVYILSYLYDNTLYGLAIPSTASSWSSVVVNKINLTELNQNSQYAFNFANSLILNLSTITNSSYLETQLNNLKTLGENRAISVSTNTQDNQNIYNVLESIYSTPGSKYLLSSTGDYYEIITKFNLVNNGVVSSVQRSNKVFYFVLRDFSTNLYYTLCYVRSSYAVDSTSSYCTVVNNPNDVLLNRSISGYNTDNAFQYIIYNLECAIKTNSTSKNLYYYNESSQTISRMGTIILNNYYSGVGGFYHLDVYNSNLEFRSYEITHPFDTIRNYHVLCTRGNTYLAPQQS